MLVMDSYELLFLVLILWTCVAACRSLRTLKGPEKQFKYVRLVNMKDPEDIRVSGMAADPPPRVEPDRLGDHHGLSAIILRPGLASAPL